MSLLRNSRQDTMHSGGNPVTHHVKHSFQDGDITQILLASGANVSSTCLYWILDYAIKFCFQILTRKARVEIFQQHYTDAP